MAYMGNLGAGQQLYIDNRGTHTFVTLTSSHAGGQQSQSSSFETGDWVVPPTLFRTLSGFVLRIESASGAHFVQIQGNGFNQLQTAPALGNADILSLQQVASTATPNPMEPMPPMEPMQMEPMKPIEPLPPLKMGDMEMRMSPMEMRMGNMEMRMGDNAPSQSGRRFCTQCGQPVKLSDRFCSACGHRLAAEE